MLSKAYHQIPILKFQIYRQTTITKMHHSSCIIKTVTEMKNTLIHLIQMKCSSKKLKDAVGNELFLSIGIGKLTTTSQSGTTEKYR